MDLKFILRQWKSTGRVLGEVMLPFMSLNNYCGCWMNLSGYRWHSGLVGGEGLFFGLGFFFLLSLLFFGEEIVLHLCMSNKYSDII